MKNSNNSSVTSSLSRNYINAVMRISPLMVFLAGASVCRAADEVYNLVPEDVAGVTVTGTITTDGNTGTLSTSDIVGWDLNLEGFGDPVETLTSAGSAGSVFIDGSLLQATSTQLSWSFPGGVGAEFSLTPVPDNVTTQWHLYTDRIDVDYDGIEYANRSHAGGTFAFATGTAPDGGLTSALLAGSVTLLGLARRRFGKV